MCIHMGASVEYGHRSFCKSDYTMPRMVWLLLASVRYFNIAPMFRSIFHPPPSLLTKTYQIIFLLDVHSWFSIKLDLGQACYFLYPRTKTNANHSSCFELWQKYKHSLEDLLTFSFGFVFLMVMNGMAFVVCGGRTPKDIRRDNSGV